ncbi:hypothetical protein PR048_014575 [Dryococelus australis]|uniref:Transmembrane protein n=1 Tax=Dryococelus australis TaxID=614101 RepID=A0ABQ9HEM0_9NEOP|nr:hypothetical protein PR048_014575 [Dryococelus australis]
MFENTLQDRRKGEIDMLVTCHACLNMQGEQLAWSHAFAQLRTCKDRRNNRLYSELQSHAPEKWRHWPVTCHDAVRRSAPGKIDCQQAAPTNRDSFAACSQSDRTPVFTPRAANLRMGAPTSALSEAWRHLSVFFLGINCLYQSRKKIRDLAQECVPKSGWVAYAFSPILGVPITGNVVFSVLKSTQSAAEIFLTFWGRHRVTDAKLTVKASHSQSETKWIIWGWSSVGMKIREETLIPRENHYICPYEIFLADMNMNSNEAFIRKLARTLSRNSRTSPSISARSVSFFSDFQSQGKTLCVTHERSVPNFFPFTANHMGLCPGSETSVSEILVTEEPITDEYGIVSRQKVATWGCSFGVAAKCFAADNMNSDVSVSVPSFQKRRHQFLSSARVRDSMEAAAKPRLSRCPEKRCWSRESGGRGGEVVSSLASHHGEPGSIPVGGRPLTLHVGTVPEDVAGRRPFSGVSCFPRPCIPALLHTHLASPSSALEISMLRDAQISLLTRSEMDLRGSPASKVKKRGSDTGDNINARLVPHRSYTQDIQCFRRNNYVTTTARLATPPTPKLSCADVVSWVFQPRRSGFDTRRTPVSGERGGRVTDRSWIFSGHSRLLQQVIDMSLEQRRNGRSLRKPADQWHRAARFSHAKWCKKGDHVSQCENADLNLAWIDECEARGPEGFPMQTRSRVTVFFFSPCARQERFSRHVPWRRAPDPPSLPPPPRRVHSGSHNPRAKLGNLYNFRYVPVPSRRTVAADIAEPSIFLSPTQEVQLQSPATAGNGALFRRILFAIVRIEMKLFFSRCFRAKITKKQGCHSITSRHPCVGYFRKDNVTHSEERSRPRKPIRNVQQNAGATIAFRFDSKEQIKIFICVIVENTVESSLQVIELADFSGLYTRRSAGGGSSETAASLSIFLHILSREEIETVNLFSVHLGKTKPAVITMLMCVFRYFASFPAITLSVFEVNRGQSEEDSAHSTVISTAVSHTDNVFTPSVEHASKVVDEHRPYVPVFSPPAARNLRAFEGEAMLEWAGEREIPEETRRPAALSGTIPTCETQGATTPGIEPGVIEEQCVEHVEQGLEHVEQGVKYVEQGVECVEQGVKHVCKVWSIARCGARCGTIVVLCGANVGLYGASMLLCGTSVVLYSASVVLYGAIVVLYGASVVLYGASVVLKVKY